jgi:hypothetical protein
MFGSQHSINRIQMFLGSLFRHLIVLVYDFHCGRKFRSLV